MTRRVILDTSSSNGRVNFAALKAAHPELAGVIVKATEGSGYVNPLFAQQVADAKAVGLLIGAYAFAHPASSGTTDVALFDRVVAGTPLPLGAWWDCEVTDGLNPATVLARFLEDLQALDRTHAGRDGIYTGRWFWDPQTAGSIPAHVERWPLWVSGYVGSFYPGLLPVPWTSCKLWQFTDNWFGTGIDASTWMGTDAEWDAWTGSQPMPPAPSGGDPHRYDGWPVLRPGSQDSKLGPMLITIDEHFPVHSWQNALNVLDHHEGPSDPQRLAVDGDFGPATQAATRALQAFFHRTVDGVVGPDTYTLAAFLLTAAHR